MKKELTLIKSALAGPNATSPTSRMCKASDNRLWAYGGAFCLSVPYASTLECGFFPDRMLAFYSVDREGAVISEKPGHLSLTHGVLKNYSVKTVPAHTIPVLQAIGREVPITTQPVHLPSVARLCRNNVADWTQGAWFEKGDLFAFLRIGGSITAAIAVACLPEGHERFAIPSDSMQALARIKSPLVSYTLDKQAVSFVFEDGTWLSSRLLDGCDPPNLLKPFEQGGDPLEFNPEVVAELLKLDLTDEALDGTEVDLIWHGKDGQLVHAAGQPEEILFEDAVDCGREFKIKGAVLRTILGLQPDELRVSSNVLTGYGAGFAVVGCLMSLTK